jgi:hypothetical protein
MRRDRGVPWGSLYSANRGTSRDKPERDPKSRDKISKAARLFGAVPVKLPSTVQLLFHDFYFPTGSRKNGALYLLHPAYSA